MSRYESVARDDHREVIRRLRDGLKRYPGVCVEDSLVRHFSA